MMIRSRATIALLTGLVLCSMALGAVPSPERDDAIQARITDVVTAMVQDGTTQEQVEALQQAADGRREALLVQLALFLNDSESTEESMVGALLVQALDDPWIPQAAYTDYPWRRNARLVPLLPRRGGHVGFHDRGDGSPWYNRCIGHFVDHQLGR